MLTAEEERKVQIGQYLESIKEATRARASEWRQKRPGYGRDYHRKAKLEVLEHYGGSPPSCDCCGETELMFLTIDHMDGNGHEMRRGHGIKGSGIYEFLRKRNFPEGYRVLCYNCNCSIGFFGYCPHNGGYC